MLYYYKMKTITLNVDSSFRSSGTNEDFVINLGDVAIRNIKSWKIGSVTVPFSFYSVRHFDNNVFKWNDGSDHSFEIPPGTYTTASLTNLMNYIASQMNALGSQTYSVTVDVFSMKLTISAASAFTINFSDNNSPYKLLGFPKAVTPSLTSHTSSNPVNLNGPNNLLITSQALWSLTGDLSWNYRNGKYYDSPVIQKFLVTGTTGGELMQYYNNSNIKYPIDKVSSFYQADFQIRDPETYEVIDLNGASWSLELVFEVEN